jgi:predicted HTH domain antitoxin
MDLQKAIAKLKELTVNKDRRASYIQHLHRQSVRLGRIARLLRVSPDEAKELLELMMEYLSSEGILTKKAVKLSRKRTLSKQEAQDNEVKLFLEQSGLCD